MDELKEHHGLHAPNHFMQDTPPRADVDEILRRKRKAREYKVRSGVRHLSGLGSLEMADREGRRVFSHGRQLGWKPLWFAELGYGTRRKEAVQDYHPTDMR
jgi:hypothetical protein